MIIDTHAHYDDKAFDEDRHELLMEAKQKGIEYIVNIGSSIESCIRTIELTKQYEFVFGAIGIHPSDVGNLKDEQIEWIKTQSALQKIVAIGEIGLDYYWFDAPREIQKKWFIKQMELAKVVQLPIIIHSRDAAKDTVDLLKEHNAKELGGIVHCYSYSKETAREFLEMDYYFGIGGVITFPNAKTLKEAVAYLPMEKIVLETDSPYLAPNPYRGKRNTSLNLTYIAKEIAQIKGISYEKVLEITNHNAKQVYQLDTVKG